ncbi:MAG: 30S ribosomal protein S16 [Candidatus Moraniibacteriota bacterium]
MLTIRFARVGKTNRAQYKIVLQDKTVAPGGRHVEILGSYDPHSKQAVLKEERIKNWISKGAQLSDSVHNLFVTKKIITDKKRTVKLPEIKAQNNTEEKQNDTEKVEEVKTEKPRVEEAKPAEEVKKEEVSA